MTDYNPLDRLQGLGETDPVLPEQFLAKRTRPMEGERRLMLAALEDAIDTVRKRHTATDPRERRAFADAVEWISSTDRCWPFAYENVCEALELDPDYLRQGVLRWLSHQRHRESADDTLDEQQSAAL